MWIRDVHVVHAMSWLMRIACTLVTLLRCWPGALCRLAGTLTLTGDPPGPRCRHYTWSDALLGSYHWSQRTKHRRRTTLQEPGIEIWSQLSHMTLYMYPKFVSICQGSKKPLPQFCVIESSLDIYFSISKAVSSLVSVHRISTEKPTVTNLGRHFPVIEVHSGSSDLSDTMRNVSMTSRSRKSFHDQDCSDISIIYYFLT